MRSDFCGPIIVQLTLSGCPPLNANGDGGMAPGIASSPNQNVWSPFLCLWLFRGAHVSSEVPGREIYSQFIYLPIYFYQGKVETKYGYMKKN